ncbi:putative polyadenylate-binding protein-interacting protein 9 [Iris pallida]|uniref:Polyadenylate-binding protein-interacting protein 9 n=1 Tax=Iris pallida TaxID=29817 RepID=A0AAX6ICY7_IRIPA|nr:putative polyadenylate-binding protein-interacting protein 9 [Iris pallida]KAJ6850891.1 putative polyadenylate-binding protein-interacting protein 9 [Iris pallida]
MAAVAESGGGGICSGDHRQLKYQSDVRDLVDLLSKLNPSAKEFVPSSHKFSPPAAGADDGAGEKKKGMLSADAPVFVASSDLYSKVAMVDGGYSYGDFGGSANNQMIRKKKNGLNQGRRRFNERVQKAQKEDSIRRTVYVSDIDQHVTEEQLATLFNTCGQVLDCRVCGDPHSVLRFAFIEFADEYGARQALTLGGTMLGFYPVKVLPSKTAILPVNPTFLPRSADEREMCTRTVYCTNIDRKVTQMEVKDFFESLCGEVSRLRLLGDHVHSTRIAFVEFVQAESALLALNCSGMLLRALPVRVSPSKTPVRPRARTASQ